MIVATIVGHLGKDAVLKDHVKGSFINFSVACRGRKKEETHWVECTMFGPHAKTLLPYLTKGTSLTAVGEFEAKGYLSKTDGLPRVGLGLVVRSLRLMGGKGQREEAKPAPAEADLEFPPQLDDDMGDF